MNSNPRKLFVNLAVSNLKAVEGALAGGGKIAGETQDHGFMYGRAFYDLDGHHWEAFWMDPKTAQ